MIDFEKINVHDLVKCYSVEGCPSGYVFNGIVLAKIVKIGKSLIILCSTILMLELK